MGIRFVTPETKRLPLSDGDFITIKQRLSHGERDAMFARMRAHPANSRAEELTAYLIAWSSPETYSVDLSEQERVSILNGLDPDSFDEITAAIKAHLDAYEQEKKLPTGGNASSPTSPSVAAIPGGMSGSEHSPLTYTT